MRGFETKRQARVARADVLGRLSPEVGGLVSGKFFQTGDNPEVGHGVLLEVPDEETRQAVAAEVSEIIPEDAPVIIEVVRPDPESYQLVA